jgi:hypothetical protein
MHSSLLSKTRVTEDNRWLDEYASQKLSSNEISYGSGDAENSSVEANNVLSFDRIMRVIV